MLRAVLALSLIHIYLVLQDLGGSEDRHPVPQREGHRPGTGGHQIGVEALWQRLGGEVGPEVDRYLPVRYLFFIPGDELALVLLEVRGAGRVQISPQPLGALKDLRPMPPQGQDPGRLAPCNAAAQYRHPLGGDGGRQSHFPLPGRRWIDCAADVQIRCV